MGPLGAPKETAGRCEGPLKRPHKKQQGPSVGTSTWEGCLGALGAHEGPRCLQSHGGP